MALPTDSTTYDNKMPGLWEEVAEGGSLPVDDSFFYVDETQIDVMGENIYTSGFASGADSYSDQFPSDADSWSSGFPSASDTWTYTQMDPGDEDSGASLLVNNVYYYCNETTVDCLGRDIWS